MVVCAAGKVAHLLKSAREALGNLQSPPLDQRFGTARWPGVTHGRLLQRTPGEGEGKIAPGVAHLTGNLARLPPPAKAEKRADGRRGNGAGGAA